MGYLDRLQPLGLLVLRVVLGVVIIAHGYPKVFGGLHRHVQFVGSLGLPGWLAYFSAVAEFFGGILVIAGLVTRFAAAAIVIDLAIAIAKVDWKHGLKGGYELPLSLAAMAFALVFFGAGPIALDSIRSGRRPAK